MGRLVLRVREARLTAGLTQAQLAEKAGVRRATVSDLERRNPKSIDLETLERIGKALALSPVLLFAEVEKVRKPTVRRGRPPRKHGT